MHQVMMLGASSTDIVSLVSILHFFKFNFLFTMTNEEKIQFNSALCGVFKYKIIITCIFELTVNMKFVATQ